VQKLHSNSPSVSKYSKILYTVPIAILFTVSIALWKGISSFLFAWVLHMMLMMVVLSINEAVMPRFRSSYFTSLSWERSGRIYELLGVNLFRKILIWIGWEKLNKKGNPVNKKAASLKRLEYGTRQSEFGHLLIFFIICLFCLFITIRYSFLASVWLLGLNIPLHIYPIILQRYNRPRFRTILARLGDTNKASR
jgi:hypothetical protein